MIEQMNFVLSSKRIEGLQYKKLQRKFVETPGCNIIVIKKTSHNG